MGKKSRDKGLRGQQEVSILLREAFPWLDPHSGAQYRKGGDTPDVVGTPWWVEVKLTKQAMTMPKVMDKAALEANDGRPPVIFARIDHGEWLVTMRAEDWIKQAAPQADEHGRDHEFESIRRRRPGWGQE